jgi:hypothetical protein
LLIEPVAEMGPKRTEEVAVFAEVNPPMTYTYPLFMTAAISEVLEGRAVVFVHEEPSGGRGTRNPETAVAAS